MVKTSVSGSDRKLDLKGGAYFLEQITNGQNKWEIKWKREVEIGKEVSLTDFENKFPKAKEGSSLEIADLENNSYWGFISGKEELNKMSGTEPQSPATKHLTKQ